MTQPSLHRKKQIWFDADDVCTDSSPLTELSLRKLTGKHIPIENWTSHHFRDIYNLDDEGIHALIESWKTDRLLENVPLLAGTKEAMDRLVKAGYEVGIITARDWHPDAEAITRKMAVDHDLPVGQIIVMDFADVKANVLLAHGVHVDGFVDDTAKHVQSCREQGWNAFLMHQPWNKQHTHLPRVHHLEAFVDHFVPPKIQILNPLHRTAKVQEAAQEKTQMSTSKPSTTSPPASDLAPDIALLEKQSLLEGQKPSHVLAASSLTSQTAPLDMGPSETNSLSPVVPKPAVRCWK